MRPASADGRRELLTRLLRKSRRAAIDEPPLARRATPERLPLSSAQKRLWLLDQLEPGGTMYTIPSVLPLTGELRVDALEAALNEIVRRHEALRTVFPNDRGEPYQVVQPFTPMRLPVVPIDAESGRAVEGKEAALVQAYARRPFDLAKGPLLRAALLRKGERDHTLSLEIHHIVSDAWSFKLITQELSALYTAFVRGEQPLLPVSSLQYADYCLWEREWLRGPRLAEELSYWKNQLAGQLPVIQLPADRARQSRLTYRGALHRFYLPKPLSDRLKTFSKDAGVTPFMTLLAVFHTVIFRYTGQTDVLVGSAFGGRNKRELHDLVGFFANTLPLRVSLAGEPSFAELLRRVREVALEAYEHEGIPFIKLVEQLRPGRDTSYSPLVQVMFVLRQKAPTASYQLPGVTLGRPMEVDGGAAKFELSWLMEEEDEELLTQIEYNADLFDPARIERLAGHYVTLLAAAMDAPEQSITALPLLTGAEWRDLDAWNPPLDIRPNRCFHRLFEERVVADPDHVAVIDGDARATYGELDARANRLAHRLRELGVGRDVLVGICLDRSIDLVTAILAIFKAGGAYVPIDPTLPAERIAWLVADAQLSLAVVGSSTRELFHAQAPTVALVDAEPGAGGAGDDVDRPLAHPEASTQLAYVIYTSGSTGKPKGVELEHAGLHNLLEAQMATFGVTPASRILQFASLSFDASIFEIVMALGAGATLVLCPHMTVGAQLVELLERQAVTHATLPPSVVANLPDAELPALRTIITAGEACPPALVDRWAATHDFFNAYGPTEATVWSTVAKCGVGRPVTIGRPIRNTQIHLLDGALQPVPVGVPGEMYIGGAGLARGYLRRPELTRERFIASPFGPPGARLYRTGDIARYLADGSIDFLGRVDDQVKVRGFRIELEEVELAILRHPAIREAAVVVKGDALEDRQLVAYYVASAPSADIGRTELRAFLKEVLPSYMVPSTFVGLEALPLTSSKKIDRQALAKLEVIAVGTGGHHPPTTPTEETVAGIWAEMLKVERVGIHDNFFELGGHSLQATQVTARLSDVFSRKVPLAMLFENPTVAELTAAIDEDGRPAAAAEATPPIAPVPDAERYRLSFAQQRLWIHDAVTPGQAEYNIPMVLDLRGPLDVANLRASLAALVSRHDVLRTRYESVDGVAHQVVTDGRLECPVVDICQLPASEQEAELRRLALVEARRPFDLGADWPVRATLVRRGPAHHALLLTIHHIAADDRSMWILLHDLREYYDAAEEGRSPALPELPVRYRDYAEWQHDRLGAESMGKQLEYWRRQLADLPQPAALLADRAGSTGALGQARADGDSVARILSPALVASLERVGRQTNCTLFMTLLAAWKAVLYRHTGQEDLVIGTGVANRDRREIANVVGYFGNTLLLRTDLSGRPTFRQLLARVRATAIGAYEHADIPFEEVVDRLGLTRDLGQAPLFRILFGFQDTLPPPDRIGAADMEVSQTDNKTAKFDAVLLIGPHPGGGLVARAQYSTELFRPDTIARALEHFQLAAEALGTRPDELIDDLSLVSKGELEARAWNASATDYPRHVTVHELFEDQVRRAPDAVAVRWGERALTYHQLNQRANRIARRLQRLGVGAETLVGLYLTRSPEWVASILGVLKAGGAYVPLDPTYPQDRIAFMLEDAGIQVLLTQGSLAEGLPTNGVQIVDVGDDDPALAGERDDDPPRVGTGEHLAYVMYTSGSTGRPKGVAVPHRAINRLVLNTNYIALGPDDRVAQGSNASFDGTTFELWAALLHGGQLVGVEKEVALSPRDLVAHIEAQGITVLFLTTALFNAVAAAVPSGLRSVRNVIFGGEVVNCDCVRDVLRHGPPGRLLHIYGPTETTAWSTWHLVREVPADARTVPIGMPVSNDEVYVLDASMRPVPIGVPGEIYIGGAGLARGYHNRPELTAERFVPRPWGAPGARLYKTGDLGRYLPSGEIEFLERRDEQVKLRGYRIELGEIEAALRAHSAIAEAVVLAREDTPGHKRLVAFVVHASAEGVRPSELRQHLSSRLPSFMVPSDFVPVDAMPLSPNGKVDRKRLAHTPLAGPARETEYVAPRSELERAISAVWQEVLRLETVGVHENFFELGGTSLLVPQVLSKLNELLSKRISAVVLFECPTISSLAAALGQDSAGAPAAALARTQEQASDMRVARSRQGERRRRLARQSKA